MKSKEKDVMNFIYNDVWWFRDGCMFFKNSVPASPHEYFEAYTAMKNERGKEYASRTL